MEVLLALSDALITGYIRIETPKFSIQEELYQGLRTENIPALRGIIHRLFAAIPYRNFTNTDLLDSEGYYASVLYAFFASLVARIIPENVTNKGQADLTVIFCWLHKSLNLRHSNYRIQTRADPDLRDYGDYTFKARVFDADRAVSNSDLLFHEKVFIRLLARPPRRQKATVEIIDAGSLEECLDFANNHAKKHDGRIFAPDEFAHYAAFEHGEFRSLGLIVRTGGRTGGRIKTLAVGYPIYTEFKHRDRMFFLDYYITTGGNDLPSLEGIIRDRFDVHTILSLYPSHGLRNLFLPTRNVLALKAVEFRESLRPCRPMLVDHK
ncbi:PD-(D/E)XK nuclease domain-containing protein [Desulfonatronum thioautotrophicum]|uniref:PD-(D/E)XK nuclease domain-containing protein n=1 Tax=Desulfonatronum thioautotrophicum TaxID=617001 RepID=UPI0005EB6E38|nr:PD-(D/E)XK nuclease domain-containing protein [Desulfonatronum thioautotrophicum]